MVRFEVKPARPGETVRFTIDWVTKEVIVEYWAGSQVVWAYHPREVQQQRQ